MGHLPRKKSKLPPLGALTIDRFSYHYTVLESLNWTREKCQIRALNRENAEISGIPLTKMKFYSL